MGTYNKARHAMSHNVTVLASSSFTEMRMCFPIISNSLLLLFKYVIDIFFADDFHDILFRQNQLCSTENSQSYFVLFICLFIIHSFSVVLDLKTTEIGEDASPMYKEQIASTKIPVTLLRSKHSSLCSACENITSEAVNFLSEKQIQDKIRTILHDTCSQTFSFEQKVIVSF